MTLWPRTLLWRTVLLIALLLGVAHLAWLQVFRVSERGLARASIAQQIVSVVNLTRAALVTAQPDRRLEPAARTVRNAKASRSIVGEPDEKIAPLPDRPILRSGR